MQILDLYGNENAYLLPLAYASNCSGVENPDRSSGMEKSLYGVYMEDAFAQKVVPSSKCLSKIEVSLASGFHNENAIVQIRRDNNGIPAGVNPNDSNYLSTNTVGPLPSNSIALSIPVNLELNDNDLINGIWIVIISSVYDPNVTTEPNTFLRIGVTDTGSGFLRKISNDSWASIPGSIYFGTYKQTFENNCVTPACSPILW